jgi:hypothetical protein
VRLNPQVLGHGVVDINCASLARGVITGCNGTIDLSAMDILAETCFTKAARRPSCRTTPAPRSTPRSRDPWSGRRSRR